MPDRNQEPGNRHPEPGDSWLAALSYVPVLGLIPYFFYSERDYVAYHARQGLVLLVVEIAGLVALWIVDTTLGRIPFLGLVIVILLRLAFYLPVLALAVLGFAKGLTGEKSPLPWLGEWGEKAPPPPRWGRPGEPS